jgi:hypothetical protein
MLQRLMQGNSVQVSLAAVLSSAMAIAPPGEAGSDAGKFAQVKAPLHGSILPPKL